MKHYFQPETNVLQVMNSFVICGTSGGPGPSAAPKFELTSMTGVPGKKMYALD